MLMSCSEAPILLKIMLAQSGQGQLALAEILKLLEQLIKAMALI